jgi:peptidoglycan/xylan/chitin deacetylase (PgdA/CDA1 family)
MLHRFADPELGTVGHDPHLLREQLSYLRKNHHNLLPIGDLIHHLLAGAPLPPKAVVFTVDDGYQDFPRVGAPIFVEFDCPVTVFLTTGFVDRKIWPWWDQVEFIFDHTSRCYATLQLKATCVQYQWCDSLDRGRVLSDVIRRLKSVSDEEKQEAIAQLAAETDVELPEAPPNKYKSMTWTDVRREASRGATFGPHSVTHPVLTRVHAQRAEQEIVDSWKRLRAETDACVPVFCYPDGKRDSFSAREIGLLRGLGFQAAITSCPGHIIPAQFSSNAPAALYALPRFGLEQDWGRFVQTVAGVERLKDALRRRWTDPS